MAVPAPAIPTGNAYTVNVARPSGEASPLPSFAFAAAPLLRRWKIPVRLHLAGDAADTNALRARLNEAGGRPSAFSPAPSPTVPGEGFWKTTLIVVENAGDLFWADERDDKKVDWDPLLVALSGAAAPDGLTAAQIAKPDLWIVSLPDQTGNVPGEADVARRWLDAGAGAVCVVGRGLVAWHTIGAVFGQSSGSRAHPEGVSPARAENPADGLGVFAAGVVTGLMRDLLSENLFDKTLLRADRECLEMRPLRLGAAVIDGLAALAAAADAPPGRGFPERAEALAVSLKGPASRPWAHKGR
jgi:hypothetical protein